MPKLDWQKFTSLPGASTENFEKLWRALIRLHYGRYGDFRELANQPGVEFHLKLHAPCTLGAVGRWYGWQCKWYDIARARTIGSRRRSEIEDSLTISNERLPGLTDWILCTRFPLTAGDQEWFYSLPTKFRLGLWTSTELDEHLTGPGEMLRGTYFGDLVLTPETLRDLHDVAVAPLKGRWTPEVHQVVAVERTIGGVLGTVDAWSDLSTISKQIALDVNRCEGGIPCLPVEFRETAQDLVSTAASRRTLLSKIEDALKRGDYDECRRSLQAGAGGNDGWDALVRALRSKRHPTSLDVTNLISDLQEVDDALHQLHDALGQGVVAVVAAAGCGKTHLAATLTTERDDRPAGILLYGRDLQRGGNLDELARRVSIRGTPVTTFEALLAAVDAAGRRASRRLPIVIDGLNEAEDPRDWKNPLAGIQVITGNYPYVLVVCTLRRDFVDDALPRGIDKLEMAGFEGDVDAAVGRYFHYYKIDPGDMRLPLPLLEHPLTLRMFCEVTNPTRHQVVGVEAMPTCLTALFDRYIEQVADRISQLSHGATRFRVEDVAEAIHRIGGTLWANAARSIAMEELRSVLADGGRTWDASIVRALEQEGILLRMRGRRPGAGDYTVVYDALAGHIVAGSLFDEFMDDRFDRWFRRPDSESRLFGVQGSRHPLAADIVHGLVGLSPRRRYGRHLWPLLTGARRADALCGAARLEAIYLDTDTVGALADLLRSGPGRHVRLFDYLLDTAAAAGHPLNARFLDSTLRGMKMSNRDLCWTEWVRLQGDRLEKDLERLETRWRAQSAEQSASDGEFLRARWVMWTLTSTVRPLRDQATRVLYRFGSRYPDALFDLAVEALTINDPYVPERMLAACYGAAMTLWADPVRDDVRAAVLRFATELKMRMFSDGATASTAHVLTGDYAAGVIEVANVVGRTSPNAGSEDDGATICGWAMAANPFHDPTGIDDEDIADAERSIRMDFGNYTIGGLIRGRSNYDFDNQDYQDVRRQIEFRIVELGYSKSLFGDIDSRIDEGNWHSRLRDGSKTDRYGKKYAWIAYFEMYGLRRDRGLLPEWREGERAADADIDPSFPELTREWVPELPDIFTGAPVDGPGWMGSDVTPAYDGVLCCERVDDRGGPWALLEGYIEQTAPEDDRRIFTFLRGVFVGNNQVGDAARAFEALRYPGNHAVPEPEGHYYLYAGEIPWSERYGDGFRSREGRGKADCREAFSRGWDMEGEGVRVEIPVCRFAWEGHHSELNQVSGALMPAPEMCVSLRLSNRQGEWDLRDEDGNVATMYRESPEDQRTCSSRLAYIRRDLLLEYLASTEQRLMWYVWGERTLHYSALQHLREDLQPVYTEYRHIHARWRILDPAAGGRVLKAEDLNRNSGDW